MDFFERMSQEDKINFLKRELRIVSTMNAVCMVGLAALSVITWAHLS